MKRTGIIALVCVLAFSLMISAGCAQEEEGAAEETEVVAVEEEAPALREIGKASETSLLIELENATGKDITGFAVKASTDEEYPTSLISGIELLENGETVLMYIEPLEPAEVESTPEGETEAEATVEDANEDAVEEEDDEKLFRTLYTVELTFDDGTTAELHDVGLEGIEWVKLCLEADGMAYIEYGDEEGNSESTLETEKAWIAEAEAAAAAAAEAAAQAEAEAAAAAEAEAQQQNNYNYDSGSGSNSGSSSGSSSGSQREDVCADDVIFR